MDYLGCNTFSRIEYLLAYLVALCFISPGYAVSHGILVQMHRNALRPWNTSGESSLCLFFLPQGFRASQSTSCGCPNSKPVKLCVGLLLLLELFHVSTFS